MSDDTTSRRPKSVLMLEDDLVFGEMIRDFLQSHGFQVTRVTNGVEGLHQILDKDFDILLCDLVMPHLPGDMFYLAVEKSKPQLCRRFVFMTGHQADPKYDEFIRKIKGSMLWKPFLLADLLSTIRRTLQKDSTPPKPKIPPDDQESKWWM